MELLAIKLKYSDPFICCWKRRAVKSAFSNKICKNYSGDGLDDDRGAEGEAGVVAAGDDEVVE